MQVTVADAVTVTVSGVKQGKEATMWEFFFGLPFNFPSLNTIPSAGVTVGTDAVTIELPNHSLYRRNYVGSFFLNLRTAIPAGTTGTLPVNISSNGVSLPLMATEGVPVTADNLNGAGIYEIHYNRYTNELYLVNAGYRPTTTTAAASTTEAATADFDDYRQ